MSEHICRNCRWWHDFERLRDCSIIPSGMGQCALHGTYPNGKAVFSQAKAAAVADEGAGLATAADFGCVQWEGRE